MTPSTFMLSIYVGEKLNSEKLKIFGKYWISTKLTNKFTTISNSKKFAPIIHLGKITIKVKINKIKK